MTSPARSPSFNGTARRHRFANRAQTSLLVAVLLSLAALSGHLLFGEPGLWLAVGAATLALISEPATASTMTLRLYRARPLHPAEAPGLWALLKELAIRADLPTIPQPYYVPSRIINAFATGSRRRSAIALTDGLLRTLSARELAGVLAHEVAHVTNDDLRVMGLADFVSRITSLMAFIAQALLLLALPAYFFGLVDIDGWGLLLLAISPHIALLAQLGLSRVREFDADATAAQLTGDPLGLASALAKIERVSRSWLAWAIPGWGNPEPSWLRTHPATTDRIARLEALAAESEYTGSPLAAVVEPTRFSGHDRRPRWFVGGYWR